ncbi:hypothetical protein C2845_PM03G02670 [Panicum miliaceum]|uniref:Gamma-soluble NSF attachment protein-like n=1 Tax=Panicum miliaceum TaxID=4540 RepID=A0A3L6TAB3_PANMI|nr:hypothetical protein C2845_PM03G02670 [Panicum miliaceum]
MVVGSLLRRLAIVMWMVGSALRRLATGGGRRGHEPIPRREEEEREVMRAAAKGFKETAFSHVHAKNWREAALAFGEQAACDLKLGDELSAASALLHSAQSYAWIHEEDEGSVAATKLALDQALALFVKLNDLQMAAVSCVELAELYVEQGELQTASDFFDKAADYYGSDRQSQHCRYEAGRIRHLLDHKEDYHQLSEHDYLRKQMYEVLATVATQLTLLGTPSFPTTWHPRERLRKKRQGH